MKKVNLSRRQFLTYSLYGGGLLICSPMLSASDNMTTESASSTLTPLLKIHPDNSMIFYSPSPDMGQGVDTSLAMLFMEELGGSMTGLKTEPLPYLIQKDAEGNVSFKAVPQGAGGSTSIPRNWTLLRNAGATTRHLLLLAAAELLGKNIETLRAEDAHVVDENGLRIPFGSLLELASEQNLPEDFNATLTDRAHWRFIGKPQASTSTEKIVKGEPLYGMDVDYPGAKVAVVAHCPYLDGDVESVSSDTALKMPGVHAVVQLPRPDLDKNYTYLCAGVAVIADDFWTAKKARDSLVIKWNKGPHHNESSDGLDQQCRDLLQGEGQIVRNDGDFKQAVDSAHKVIKRDYQLPLVSHAQMEPQNCIAHVTDTNCTIIGPMQSPGGASRLAEEITGIDRTTMDIRYTRLGGGFGRRLRSDHVAEAVTIAKKSGLPVKLIWTREDDMAHDFYRPMGHHQLIAGIDESGKVTAWAHRLAGTPKYYRRGGKPEELYRADMYVDDFPANRVPNLINEYFVAKSGTPQGSWRAPAHTVNAFVVQSFLDEMAIEMGVDPLQLRLTMLGESEQLPYGQHGGPHYDTGRMKNVLEQVAKMAQWGRKMPKGEGLGLSGHFTFGGYCAQVAHVKMRANNQWDVKQVWCAIDVGTVIHPDGIVAQMEGGINDGLSTAMGQKVKVLNGQVISENFDTYPMIRIADSVGKIDVHIVDSDADPAGAGEMSTPVIAAAVANAIVAAGGERLRSQPFQPV